MPNLIIKSHNYLKTYFLIYSDVNVELMTNLANGIPIAVKKIIISKSALFIFYRNSLMHLFSIIIG